MCQNCRQTIFPKIQLYGCVYVGGKEGGVWMSLYIKYTQNTAACVWCAPVVLVKFWWCGPFLCFPIQFHFFFFLFFLFFLLPPPFHSFLLVTEFTDFVQNSIGVLIRYYWHVLNEIFPFWWMNKKKPCDTQKTINENAFSQKGIQWEAILWNFFIWSHQPKTRLCMLFFFNELGCRFVSLILFFFFLSSFFIRLSILSKNKMTHITAWIKETRPECLGANSSVTSIWLCNNNATDFHQIVSWADDITSSLYALLFFSFFF